MEATEERTQRLDLGGTNAVKTCNSTTLRSLRCGRKSFTRFYSLDEAQELYTFWHDRRWRILACCKHDGLVERAVHKQTCQRFPPLPIQQVSPIDHNKSQARYHCQSNLECHAESKLL